MAVFQVNLGQLFHVGFLSPLFPRTVIYGPDVLHGTQQTVTQVVKVM